MRPLISILGWLSGVYMQITVTQFLALALLSLSFARSSPAFLSLVERLKQASATSFPSRIAFGLFASVTALPNFFCSSKVVDFVILLAKV
jgi:membrane-associated phospholipid phosphatase